MLPGVSKTAIVTLRARVEEHARADGILVDPLAAEWWTHVTWDPELDGWKGQRSLIAMRADDIDRVVAAYAAERAVHSVVELGAGLSTRHARLAALPHQHWLDVDLPEVVSLRRVWGVTHAQLACSVLDHTWMDHVPGPPDAHVFILEGLLYYLPRAEVDALFLALRRRFAGSVIVMDVLGQGDYPQLLANTTAVGTPIAWAFEGPYDEVLPRFGLDVVPGLEPERTYQAMLARYWQRLDAKIRGALVIAQGLRAVWQARSGVVLGRLPPV